VDASDPPFEPASVDVVLARHILWTLPHPSAALRRWAGLLRPGGRLVLIEGRWGIEAPELDPFVRGSGEDGDDDGAPAGGAPDLPPSDVPWRAGVPSEELALAVRDLGLEPVVVQLTDQA